MTFAIKKQNCLKLLYIILNIIIYNNPDSHSHLTLNYHCAGLVVVGYGN